MFDLNLLGKSGIQPERVTTAYSFIGQKTPPAPPPVIPPEEDPYFEDQGAKRRTSPILIIAIIGVLLAGAYFLISRDNQVVIHPQKESISVHDEIANVIDILSSLSNKIHVQRFLLTPEIILVNLRSPDQIELNMLSVDIEDRLKTHCRISGNKDFGVLLSFSIPITYNSIELNNTAPVREIMYSNGIETINETGLKLSAVVNDDKVSPLLSALLETDQVYYKKIWIECKSDGSCQFELLFDTSLTE